MFNRRNWSAEIIPPKSPRWRVIESCEQHGQCGWDTFILSDEYYDTEDEALARVRELQNIPKELSDPGRRLFQLPRGGNV